MEGLMPERRCKNWLSSFLQWTLPRSESPETIILWTGLSTIASVTKRHVYLPKALMGSYILYPHLYIVVVGKPGVVRKSTSIGYSETLLSYIDDVTVTASATSDSKLVETLSITPDSAVTIISSEFGTFMATSKEKMYDLLTDLFDGKIKHDYSTRLHGLELAINPCINLLAATTPKWIATQPPDILTGGGFSSRVIFVYESQVRQRRMYYDNVQWEEVEALREDLIHDLEIIMELEGEFKHEDRFTRDAMEQWYLDNADNPIDDERVEGYFQRKPTHVHKVSMLLSLAERDDLIITMEHFQKALALLDAIEARMPKALLMNGRNPYADEIDRVREYIAHHEKGVGKSKLLGRFYNDLSPAALDDVLSALVIMGDVQAKKGDGKPTYHYIGKAGL
jgi:hypothetical protein